MNCLQYVETIRWPWTQILGSSSRVRRPPAHHPRVLSWFHKLLEFQSALASKTLILRTSPLRYWAQNRCVSPYASLAQSPANKMSYHYLCHLRTKVQAPHVSHRASFYRSASHTASKGSCGNIDPNCGKLPHT